MKPKTPDRECIRETFKEFLTSKGLRVTNQRLAIFDAAYGHRDHFTAEDLLDRAREIDATVSRATVYRALPILTESSLIREVDVGRDYKFYMANKNATTFQAQVICLDCDKIFEIDAPFMEWYGKTVADKLSLEVETQRLQVSAHCTELKAAGICERGDKKR
ncbi:MAG: transcriptional repressor [Opitutae bacterium]|jgi:Fur family ferric uptake transcriptional regulator|nr:transcriptional repressor [Opitutae bacterium]